jgi:RND family efflux transporter MFP subunit
LLKVRAPFDGTITDVTTRAGQAIMPTDTLGQLTDLTRLVARVRVPGPEAAKLRIGQRVALEDGASDQQTQSLIGQVDYIDQRVDPNNDTVAAWVTLPIEAAVHPGRFVRGRITVAEYTDRLAVPDESVVTTPEGQTVVAMVKDGAATLTPVRRGVSEDGWVEVEGQRLESGMTVVTVGAYGLPGETRIRVMNP